MVLANRDSTSLGKPRNARTSSSLPRLSAIRMVAAFAPPVLSSRRRRKLGGTSRTERYTSVLSPVAMNTVELFVVSFCIPPRAYDIMTQLLWEAEVSSSVQARILECYLNEAKRGL